MTIQNRLAIALMTFLVPMAYATTASAQTGAAITVIKVGIDGGNQHDFKYYGQSGGIAAYSPRTTLPIGNMTTCKLICMTNFGTSNASTGGSSPDGRLSLHSSLDIPRRESLISAS